MYHRRLGLFLALLVCFIVPLNLNVAVTQAESLPTTWYVDNGPTGNDGSSCLTPSSPCLTISGALSKAASGDIISIAPGRYTGGIIIFQSVTLNAQGPDATASSDELFPLLIETHGQQQKPVLIASVERLWTPEISRATRWHSHSTI